MSDNRVSTNVQAPDSGLSSGQLAAMISARRGTILKTTLITVALTFVITLVLPKTYTASSDIYIDYKGSNAISAAAAISPMLDESYMQTQFDMIKSQAVADRVIDSLDLTASADYQNAVQSQGEPRAHANLLKNIIDHTLIITHRSSRVIEVEYAARSAIKSRDFANAVVTAYIGLTQEIESKAARSRTEQYNIQLENLRKEADNIQQKLTQYQQEVGILDVNEHNDILSRALNDNVTALTTIQNQQEEAEARNNATNILLKRGVRVDELPEIAERPNINDLKTKLSDANKRLSDIESVLGPQHPKTLAAIAERASLTQRIAREARSTLEARQSDAQRMKIQQQTIQQQIDEQTAKLLADKKDRDVITSYQRQLESVDRVYNAALQKYDSVLMASNISTPNLTVLRIAEEPTSHAKPLMLQNLAASVIIGLLLGLSLALLYEISQRRLRSLDDLLRGIHLPMLGQIGADPL
ncbi:Wzz/FepE/Etk N-terminal domain-containing protein [Herbaspirillum sp. RTI4]|uniref:Wzz/FepE/Etk N-terminal domain-containing protein n=1 Tax=Herbaspirillum sp. RTI4 TaxID=3048640 RepID=UPI002AB3E2E4|nr:Wzz/FepE/Etk N-terminal domain-containing protein [Herbaspirillum sp. RTI4]MDY7578267.1 Wzz/FepE/Etk N-terminal domain-containing protein [Herbaspirillum sp. RTI4]MEA9981240.1 Wzz/FepE/Etk N-terminal domain-containing protein [Herbaspirillum sp. RTI4]